MLIGFICIALGLMILFYLVLKAMANIGLEIVRTSWKALRFIMEALLSILQGIGKFIVTILTLLGVSIAAAAFFIGRESKKHEDED